MSPMEVSSEWPGVCSKGALRQVHSRPWRLAPHICHTFAQKQLMGFVMCLIKILFQAQWSYRGLTGKYAYRGSELASNIKSVRRMCFTRIEPQGRARGQQSLWQQLRYNPALVANAPSGSPALPLCLSLWDPSALKDFVHNNGGKTVHPQQQAGPHSFGCPRGANLPASVRCRTTAGILHICQDRRT